MTAFRQTHLPIAYIVHYNPVLGTPRRGTELRQDQQWISTSTLP
jgi:hypothetical protein